MRTVVAKFGGTSLADAQQIRKTGKIILSDPDRRYIVVSAPGKRSSKDSKVTDLLLRCYEAAVKGTDYEQDLQLVQERFREMAEELELDLKISEEIEPLRAYLAETAGAGKEAGHRRARRDGDIRHISSECSARGDSLYATICRREEC